MKATTIILALGSNTHQHKNISMARKELRQMLPDIVFSKNKRTKPIKIESEPFLNCVGIATTTLTQKQLQSMIRGVERMAGDKEDDHRHGIVNLDIDLLAFGNLRLHEEDWHREYIKELLKEINYNI